MYYVHSSTRTTILLLLDFLLFILYLYYIFFCTVYAPCGIAQILLFTDLFCVIMTNKPLFYSILFLGKGLANGTLGVPPPSELPSAPGLGQVTHVVVADEAFPMKPYLLRPYSGKGLPEDERIFNYRLSRARRIVENAFGILSHRWRVYQGRMQLSPGAVDSVIKATCILCNYLRPGRPIYVFYCVFSYMPVVFNQWSLRGYQVVPS